MIPKHIEEKREKAKRPWLKFAISLFAIVPICRALELFSFYSHKPLLISLGAPLLFFSLISGISFAIYYHCAYRCSGTKLLIFFLIVSPLSNLKATSFSLAFLIVNWRAFSIIERSLCIGLDFLFLSLFVLFWIFSFKLRTANKAFKRAWKAYWRAQEDDAAEEDDDCPLVS